MFKVKSISFRNFMSFGNVEQKMALDMQQLTLILGENLDTIGSGPNSRNGAGKTSILNAICFAFYGESVSNIKKDNLINLTNEKNLEVALDFEQSNISYRIERGRKPNYFRFFVGGKELTNEAQGDSSETQAEVEKVIGLSQEMFKQIVGLNTTSEPFLALDAKSQREIIEELLGITQLSDKANNLRELLRDTKNGLEQELYRIQTVENANKKVHQSITDLRSRSQSWQENHERSIGAMEVRITALLEINVDEQIEIHKKLSEKNQFSTSILALKREKVSHLNNLASVRERKVARLSELVKITEHSCPTCGQTVHDVKQDEIKKSLEEKVVAYNKQDEELTGVITPLEDRIEEEEKKLIDLGDIAKPFYKTIEEAYNHRSKLDSLGSQLEKLITETNPYDDHIISQQENLLQDVDLETSQGLKTLVDHQEFLLKLLTNKDSAVRKKIIDQNLNYLNYRLSHYVEKLGLPHTVTFINDLSVEIQEHGRDLDFDNLSRGERTRLILGLSFAFRDVYESLNSTINMLFLDEIIDLGLDGSGLEHALELLKKLSRETSKSIFLVSHREELTSRVNNVLLVTKENGFSKLSYNEA